MNKKLIATLLSALLMAGFASAQEQTTTAPAATTSSPEAVTTTAGTPSTTPDSCCKPQDKSSCAMDKSCEKDMACDKGMMKKSCHDVLTKEERHRFCAAKTAAIAANPALGGKGNKRALCEAICKQDPSMEPIMMKLKKHCEEMRKKMAKTTPVSTN